MLCNLKWDLTFFCSSLSLWNVTISYQLSSNSMLCTKCTMNIFQPLCSSKNHWEQVLIYHICWCGHRLIKNWLYQSPFIIATNRSKRISVKFKLSYKNMLYLAAFVLSKGSSINNLAVHWPGPSLFILANLSQSPPLKTWPVLTDPTSWPVSNLIIKY